METYADQFAHDAIAQEALRLAYKYHRPNKWAHALAYYIIEMEINAMARTVFGEPPIGLILASKQFAERFVAEVEKLGLPAMPRPHAPKKKPMKPSKKRPMPQPY